jgi:predicted secreted protein
MLRQKQGERRQDMIEISLIFGLAIYGIVWFLTLFIVLPFGVVAQNEADNDAVPGSAESAPTNPMIGRKLLITTALASLLYGLVYWLLTSGIMATIDLPFFPEINDGRG